VFVDAFESIANANKVVGHVVFAKSYLGHVSKKVDKHCFSRWERVLNTLPEFGEFMLKLTCLAVHKNKEIKKN